MKTITMDKSKLLDIVRANRDKHRAIFLEALDGYRKSIIAELEKRLDDARNGRKINHAFVVIEPMDQTKTYDQAIQMLEFHTGSEIQITHEEFRNYVYALSHDRRRVYYQPCTTQAKGT